VAAVDPGRNGLDLTVFMEIEAADHTPEWRDAFAATVTAHPAILEVHRMAGEADYLLKVVVADMQA
jgi:Lrp/AsnC family transcriptional regulator